MLSFVICMMAWYFLNKYTNITTKLKNFNNSISLNLSSPYSSLESNSS